MYLLPKNVVYKSFRYFLSKITLLTDILSLLASFLRKTRFFKINNVLHE